LSRYKLFAQADTIRINVYIYALGSRGIMPQHQGRLEGLSKP
jgi:hypothetical protein